MNTCLVSSYLFEAWSVEQLKSPNLQISELHFHQQTQGSLPLSSFLTFRWSHNCLGPLERSIHKLHPNHRQKELHCTRSRPKHLWAHKKQPPTMQLWMWINLPADHPSCSLSMCVHLIPRMLIRVSQTPNPSKNKNLNHWCFSKHIAFAALSCWMPILARLQSGHSAHMLLQRDVKKSATPSGVIEWIRFASWEGDKGREHDKIFQVYGVLLTIVPRCSYLKIPKNPIYFFWCKQIASCNHSSHTLLQSSDLLENKVWTKARWKLSACPFQQQQQQQQQQ